ncbi:hypothetical protein J7L06_07490 [Candidatus Bathyarchaeota archaeon]|nr:hypothetical protein [Candidatus Bathyarchaeota archaeon]
MGRRRKKIVKLPKKRVPTVFLCPSCGKESIKVEIDRKSGTATVRCGSCGLTREIKIKSIYGEVDAYCMFIDSYYASSEAAEDVSGKREG